MLVPKGAKKPRWFEISERIRTVRYTDSLETFYYRPNGDYIRRL